MQTFVRLPLPLSDEGLFDGVTETERRLEKESGDAAFQQKFSEASRRRVLDHTVALVVGLGTCAAMSSDCLLNLRFPTHPRD